MKISVLGSTGSIGTQTLEIAKLEGIEILGLTAYSNAELLIKQIKEFKPKKAAVMSESAYKELKSQNLNCEILFGMEGITEIACLDETELVLNALVGNAGLLPTVHAIKKNKNIALANKETLVTGGKIVKALAKEKNVKIYPVDSEHSAIFQCLNGEKESQASKIYLTASGGPFRNSKAEDLKSVTVEDALKHPNWSMGRKITIDSATMMNKGLEVIEAKWLFDINEIDVLIHPQSIIHSMVEFCDGAVLAQMGVPDMKVPISYALTYPNRAKLPYERTNFLDYTLTFEKPDLEKFRCLFLAYEAFKIGGDMCTVLNAANEIAVEKFLDRKISFLDIPRIIESTMLKHKVSDIKSVEDILETDKLSRRVAAELIDKI